MNIRLYNAKILTMEKHKDVFEGEIWIKNEKIAYLGETKKLQAQITGDFPTIHWDLELDCGGNLLMPGFKNAHTHSAMTFLRSSPNFIQPLLIVYPRIMFLKHSLPT